MTIEKKIIKINRNHDNRLIKLKYSTILEIIKKRMLMIIVIMMIIKKMKIKSWGMDLKQWWIIP